MTSNRIPTIAIYWDLDFPPAGAAVTGGHNEPSKEFSATLTSCLALARSSGTVGVQRAIGGPTSQRTGLARRLARSGVELVLTPPLQGRRRDDRLIGLIECIALDLWKAIDGVVVISLRPDLGAAERFVRSAGRQWLVLRGPEAGDRVACMGLIADTLVSA